MADSEIRPFIPIGAGFDVLFSVVVKIAKIGSFAYKLMGECELFPVWVGERRGLFSRRLIRGMHELRRIGGGRQ